MNNELNIQSILGYVAKDNPLRASRDGKEFGGIIPAPAWSEEVVVRNGSVINTVNEMRKIIKKYHWQAAKVAMLLKDETLQKTCENIWNFLFYHINYNEDTPGKEELRTFARTWAQRETGVDCDDFSIAAGSLLYCLNIPFYIRIARYAGKTYFQHVYDTVPFKDKEYITIDGVLDEYDAEKPPVEFKDFLVMNTNSLNGIDISVLGSIEDDNLNEISGILSGADFDEIGNLEGLGEFASRAQELNALKNHLWRTRHVIAKRPELIRESEHPETFLGMVDYALKYWDTNKRDEALGILSGEEDRLNELSGLGSFPDGHESIELFYGLNGEGTYDVLGKAKKQHKFFKKIKAAVKKAGKGIKKIGKGIVRYNPVTAGIRSAILLALKVNLFKVGTKLKWGYLTQEEAKQHGFNISEWQKVKKHLATAEKLFVKDLQGKAENFKRAIITGRAGGLSGIDEGLGVVVAAASTAAAVPFLTKILTLLKKIDYKKLINNVDVKSLIKRKKQADADTPTEDGGTSVPENPDSSDGGSSGGGSSEDNAPDNSTPDTNDTDNNDTPSEETTASPEMEGSDNTGEQDEAPQDQDNDTSEQPSEETTDTPTTDDAAREQDNGELSDNVNAPKGKRLKDKIKPFITKLKNKYLQNGNNLPATQNNKLPAVIKHSAHKNAVVVKPTTTTNDEKVPDPNFFLKAVDWVKDNPSTSILIGAGAAFLIYELVKPSPTLSGAPRKGKRKKGKAKTNPPQTISGTKPKRKRKKRAKAGRSKTVKL